MSKKLMNDPAVAELVTKEAAKAVAAALKEVKGRFKAKLSGLKTLVDTHVGDAKTAGNPDAAKRLKALGGDATAALRELEL